MLLNHPLLRRRLAAAATALVASASQAAPVTGTSAAPESDPYELALRWTMASLGTTAGAAPSAPQPVPAPVVSRLPLGAASVLDGGVPDPSAYALMGLALLGAGLLARHLTRSQRGFSKKT